VCRRLTGNDADAADAAQETMISLVRNLQRFDGRSRFSTWAYRVAVNASLDELRRRQRRPRLLDGDAEVESQLVGDRVESGEAAVDNRLLVDAALVQLPIEFRAAVVLRDLCTLDYADIAEALGIPPGTVRSRIARGRAQLADLLAAAGRPPREPGLPLPPSNP
jgi:RNA polymerase sigma-70 factor (ECF subfamily)